MEDEAETWQTCLGHYPLQKLCFYFGRIRTLVAMATKSFHRLIMGKVEIDKISAKSLGIFDFFYRNVYCVVLHVSYDFCPNRLILLVDGAT